MGGCCSPIPPTACAASRSGSFESEWSGVFFLILSNVEDGQKSFNSDQKWAAAPAPPWALARYALDLAHLAQPGLLDLSRF